MAQTRIVQKIRPGLSEYYTSFTPAAVGDKLIMAFKSEVTIDDLLVTVDTGASIAYKLSLFYPSSKVYSKIADNESSDWMLNPLDTASAVWHQMPSGAAVELEIQTFTTEGEINLLVVGR